MKPKELFGLLDHKITCEHLRENIHQELVDYEKGVRKNGAVAPVRFPKKNTPYLVKNIQVQRLLEYFLDGKLNDIEISYFASAMTISEWIRFKSEEVEDFVSCISDFNTYRPMTRDEINNFIQTLGT